MKEEQWGGGGPQKQRDCAGITKEGHQENVGAWSKVVLNAPGPPRGVVVPVVHLVHSDLF